MSRLDSCDLLDMEALLQQNLIILYGEGYSIIYAFSHWMCPVCRP